MTTDQDWVCIYKATKLFDAEAVKGNLEAASIPCVLLNKQDSSYLSFGYIEIHVPEAYRAAADGIVAEINGAQ